MKNLRTCIACREKKDASEMFRIAKNKIGEIAIDDLGKNEGHGAYVCKNKECITKAEKNKSLNRVFKCQVESEAYKKLNIRGEKFGK